MNASSPLNHAQLLRDVAAAVLENFVDGGQPLKGIVAF